MPNFVDTKQVAAHFGCDKDDVSFWCRSGLLKTLPRKTQTQPWRIFPSEIERLEREGLPLSRRTLSRR